MRDLAVLFALSKEEAESFKTVPRAVRSDYMHDNIEDIFLTSTWNTPRNWKRPGMPCTACSQTEV